MTFAGRGDVDTVFVGGAVRKWRGELVGQDLGRIQSMVEASREHLLKAHAQRSSERTS